MHECGEDGNVETVCSRTRAVQVVAGCIGPGKKFCLSVNQYKLAEM